MYSDESSAWVLRIRAVALSPQPTGLGNEIELMWLPLEIPE
jgi:hypothetical protein